MATIIESISEILKEEKWTRTSISEFSISMFESYDSLIKDIQESYQISEVCSFLENYLKSNSNSIIALYFLSIIYSISQDYKGNEWAKKLIEIFDENRRIKIVKYLCEKYLGYSHIYKNVLSRYIQILEDEKKEETEIVPYMESLHKIDFTDAKITRKLAIFYENSKNLEKAILYYKKLFDISANSKIQNEVEELWKKLLSFEQIEPDYFFLKLNIIENINLKLRLAEKLIEHFESIEDWDLVIDTIKITYELIPDKNKSNLVQKLRDQIVNAYRKKYSNNSQLEEFLKRSRITEKWKNLSVAISEFEKYIPFDKNKYVFHQLSGLGFIKDINENFIVVDFEKKKNHQFSITMALKALRILDDNDFLVLEAYHPEKLQKLGEENPKELLINLLKSYNKPLSTKDIKTILTRVVIPVASWEKFWNSLRNEIKDDPLIIRNATSYSLRNKPALKEESIYERFKSEENLIHKAQIYLNYISEENDFQSEYSQAMLRVFQNFLREDAIIHQNLVIAFLFLKDLKSKYSQLNISLPFDSEYLFSKLIEEKKYIFNFRDSNFEKLFFTELMVYTSNWPQIMGEYLLQYPSKFIISTLISKGFSEIIKEKSKDVIRNAKDNPEVFLWFLKNIFNHPEFSGIVDKGDLLIILANLLDIANKSIIQKINVNANRKLFTNIGDAIFKEKLLESYLEQNPPENQVSKLSTIFLRTKWKYDDYLIEFKTLLAKYYPEILSKISPEEKDENENIFYSTIDSIKEKQEHLQFLIKQEIPRVNREMMIAKEKGDLRENAEYHSARETLQSLNIEAAELQRDLNNVKPIDPNNISLDKISIGTKCRLKSDITGKETTYTILGKWDIDLNNNIISYETELGKILLNKKIGDIIINPIDNEEYKVISIEKGI